MEKFFVLALTVLSIIMPIHSPASAQQVVDGFGKIIMCTSRECMNNAKIESATNRRLTPEEVEKILCSSEGKVWKEKDVMYVFDQKEKEVVDACFLPRWHTFVWGGAE